MAWFVLGAWVIQACVGVVLLVGWLRHSGVPGAGARGRAAVLAHLLLSLVALGLWVAFVLTHRILLGWVSLGGLTVGNALGDLLLVRRSRRASGNGLSWRADYGTAIRNVFTGRFPRRVAFHALFAGVVYFGALAACLMT